MTLGLKKAGWTEDKKQPVIMCDFTQGFINCDFYLIKISMMGCDTSIVCFIVEWLIVSVDVSVSIFRRTLLVHYAEGMHANL